MYLANSEDMMWLIVINNCSPEAGIFTEVYSIFNWIGPTEFNLEIPNTPKLSTILTIAIELYFHFTRNYGHATL